MKYQAPCSTRQGTSVPIWFLPESMPGHMTSLLLFTATSSLSLLGLQGGPQAGFMRGAKCPAPVLLYPRASGLPWPAFGPTAFSWLCSGPTLMPHTSLSFHNAPRPPAHLLPRDASFLCLTRQSQLFLTYQLSCAAVPGATQDPKLCFHNQQVLQVSHLFVNQNPLPLATWPASFYFDNMFCHLGKCKQISRPSHFFFFLIDVSLTYNTQLFSLPVGKCRKKGRENACKPEPYQSPIRKSLKLSIWIRSSQFLLGSVSTWSWISVALPERDWLVAMWYWFVFTIATAN